MFSGFFFFFPHIVSSAVVIIFAMPVFVYLNMYVRGLFSYKWNGQFEGYIHFIF